MREIGSARTVQTYPKLRLSSCTVSSWKIRFISSCLRRMLVPLHKPISRTWTSVILWPAELKCCGTGHPRVWLRSLHKCSPDRLLRLRPVSPIDMGASTTGYAVHKMLPYLHMWLPISRLVFHTEEGLYTRNLCVIRPFWHLLIIITLNMDLIFYY